jgi:hypothetical protein
VVPGNAVTAAGDSSAQVDQAGGWASAQLAHSRIDSRPSWAGYAFIRCLYGERPERRARQLVAEVMAREVAADIADVQLAVSELVSNALQHAPGPHELRMVFKRAIVKVAVLDGGTDHTELAEKLRGAAARQSASDESGRGLQIVTGLFPGAWGTGPAMTCTGHTPAKEVWIEVNRLPVAEAGDLR